MQVLLVSMVASPTPVSIWASFFFFFREASVESGVRSIARLVVTKANARFPDVNRLWQSRTWEASTSVLCVRDLFIDLRILPHANIHAGTEATHVAITVQEV